MKPVDIKPSAFIGFNKEDDKESPKLKIGDNFRILKYKIIFANGYVPNCSEELFVIKKVKNTVLSTHESKIVQN